MTMFNTKWEYPMMHIWCKFGVSSFNLMMSYRADKYSVWTERRMDRRTDAGNDNTWKAKG